jgi:Zn-dependent peptidase ImmA (M78 family)
MLRRGFKTWCERAALDYKRELGVPKQDPLWPTKLATHLHVKLLTPQDVPGLDIENRSILLGEESNAWSAVTLCKGEKNIVIYNPSNSQGRQSNDIMHELSHVILGHKAQMIHSLETGIFMRHYDKSQEEEADWLAGTLLLSKDALFRIAFSTLDHSVAAREFGVSNSLLTMRLNLSGVNTILKRSTGSFGK